MENSNIVINNCTNSCYHCFVKAQKQELVQQIFKINDSIEQICGEILNNIDIQNNQNKVDLLLSDKKEIYKKIDKLLINTGLTKEQQLDIFNELKTTPLENLFTE